MLAYLLAGYKAFVVLRGGNIVMRSRTKAVSVSSSGVSLVYNANVSMLNALLFIFRLRA